MSHAGIKINLGKLYQIRELLNEKVVIKTGIFQEDDKRDDGGSNIEIGTKHEFGNFEENLPQRSFLRMPFFVKKDQIMDVAVNSIAEGLKEGNLGEVYNKIADECTHVVKGAFASGGYGNWKPLTDFTVGRKGNSTILVETGQLRDVIKSKVEKQ